MFYLPDSIQCKFHTRNCQQPFENIQIKKKETLSLYLNMNEQTYLLSDEQVETRYLKINMKAMRIDSH